MAFHLVSGTLNPTNASLLDALREAGLDARLTLPADLSAAHPGDVVLGRLDVTPTLEGVEPGMWELRRAKARGIHVFNEPGALLAAHDKLMTVSSKAPATAPRFCSRRLKAS